MIIRYIKPYTDYIKNLKDVNNFDTKYVIYNVKN